MSLFNALAREDSSREGTGEGVASTYRVSNLDLRRRHEALKVVRSKDIAAVGTTGQYDHLEVITLHDKPAFLLDVETRIAKEAADDDEFLIVNLEDVAMTEAILNGVLVVEVATEVDVEDLQAVFRCSLDELMIVSRDSLLR